MLIQIEVLNILVQRAFLADRKQWQEYPQPSIPQLSNWATHTNPPLLEPWMRIEEMIRMAVSIGLLLKADQGKNSCTTILHVVQKNFIDQLYPVPPEPEFGEEPEPENLQNQWDAMLE